MMMWVLALLATAAARNVSVVLPGNYVEVTSVVPANLPPCASDTWAVQGKTYDGLAACAPKAGDNATAAVLLSINPFRCARYSTKTDVRGVFGCDRCYFGSHSTPTEVFPALLPNNKSNVFYVREVITGAFNMTSCLYTQAKGLTALCDVIVRDSIGGPSPAKCVKGAKTFEFAAPLNDAAPCKQYEVASGKIRCK